MKITLDTDLDTLTVVDNGAEQVLPLYSKQAFEVISRQWVRVGWDQKYQYTFSWFGRPVIQLPEDMLRIQEVIYAIQPDVIIETGVAHGGSLVFYASLMQAIGKGRVIGIDIDIRHHNRVEIQEHPLFHRITLLEGSSVEPTLVSKVSSMIAPGEKVLIILDSDHSYQHVMAELGAYAHLVSNDSYIVATDGIMYDLTTTPRGKAEWAHDNPRNAAADFAAVHPEFCLEQPSWPFNESQLENNITHWPGAWLRRVKA